MQKGFILSIAFSICIISTSVIAATFNVSNTSELRQALLDAAQNGQEDTIVLANGTYATTDGGGGTFTFLDNQNYDLTLQGSSRTNTILSGNNSHQVINFNIIGSTKTIHLSNLSVINGTSSGAGGGIFSEETLEIQNCEISNNHAATDGGGFFSSSTITVTDSTITGNSANTGGGFYTTATTNITGSTVTENSAVANGGGFYADSVTISDSTITGNSAGNAGGGGFYAALTAIITGSSKSEI